MTLVYQAPGKANGLRVVAVGAGAYPNSKGGNPRAVPLNDLTSVPPSVMTFLERLLVDWRADLAMDLLSVDLLLSDPAQPGGAVWPGFGVAGEAVAGTPVDPPTFANMEAAILAAAAGSKEDGLLLLFCGHGFSRGDRYFVPSDFGKPGDPWRECVNLNGLDLGLQQEPPRTQWLFWDCCADIPQAILDNLTQVGHPIVAATASQLSAARGRYGDLSRFGLVSSPIGQQAFGIPGKPSRFTEMLIEAIDGAGAIKGGAGGWWVDDVGIKEALRTYVARHPELTDPPFYRFVTPSHNESPDRMRFRKMAAAPMSLLVATSRPARPALKQARIRVAQAGGPAPLHTREPPGPQAVFQLRVPALQHYDVTAEFDGVPAPVGSQTKQTFADLPLAWEVDFDSP